MFGLDIFVRFSSAVDLTDLMTYPSSLGDDLDSAGPVELERGRLTTDGGADRSSVLTDSGVLSDVRDRRLSDSVARSLCLTSTTVFCGFTGSFVVTGH